jgi:hypothetical protein
VTVVGRTPADDLLARIFELLDAHGVERLRDIDGWQDALRDLAAPHQPETTTAVRPRREP